MSNSRLPGCAIALHDGAHITVYIYWRTPHGVTSWRWVQTAVRISRNSVLSSAAYSTVAFPFRIRRLYIAHWMWRDGDLSQRPKRAAGGLPWGSESLQGVMARPWSAGGLPWGCESLPGGGPAEISLVAAAVGLYAPLNRSRPVGARRACCGGGIRGIVSVGCDPPVDAGPTARVIGPAYSTYSIGTVGSRRFPEYQAFQKSAKSRN